MPATLIALVDDLRLEFSTARVDTRAVINFDGYDIEVEKDRASKGSSPAEQKAVAVRFRRQLDVEELLHLQIIVAHATQRLLREQAQLDEDLALGLGPNPTHQERFRAKASHLPGCTCDRLEVLAGKHMPGCRDAA